MGDIFVITEQEELAIINYIISNDSNERNKIFNEILNELFIKLIESILEKNLKYINNRDIKIDTLCYLVENIIKFNPYRKNKYGENYKVLSYIKTLIRSYLCDYIKKEYNQTKRYQHFDDHKDDLINRSIFVNL